MAVGRLSSAHRAGGALSLPLPATRRDDPVRGDHERQPGDGPALRPLRHHDGVALHPPTAASRRRAAQPAVDALLIQIRSQVVGEGVYVVLGIVALLQTLTTVQQWIVLRAMRRSTRPPPPPVGPMVETRAPPLELDFVPTLVQRARQRVSDSLRPLRDSLRPRAPRRPKRRTLDEE